MWALYESLYGLGLLFAAPFLLLRRGRHYLATVPGRFGGHSGRVEAGGLWIHAVSVGEVGVAATLAAALGSAPPLVVTTITPTGQERATRLLSRRAAIAYLPFEFRFALRRFFRRFTPRALVLVEGDFWPLALREARRRGLPVYVINARISDRSFPRLARVKPLVRRLLLDPVERFGVQTAADRDRLLALGVHPDRVVVTGNLKFDSPEPPRSTDLEPILARFAAGRPILVAGSTMAGEEEAVLTGFRLAGGGERALLLLAPRHPERFAAVKDLLAGSGLAFAPRTAIPSSGSPPAVLLLDSLGELAAAYRGARGAFIGGTLVETGGHNPLEAARFAVPVAVGPSMENFREIADLFDAARAWERVADGAALGAAFARWLDDPAAARELGARGAAIVESNRGALARTLALLAPALAKIEARGAA